MFGPCSRAVHAFTHSSPQCTNEMTAIDTQWTTFLCILPAIFAHLHTLPRRLHACVNSLWHFFGTWSRFAAHYIYIYIYIYILVSHTPRLIQHVEYQRQCCCRTEKVSIILLRQDYCISRRRRNGTMSNRKVLRQKKR